MAINPAAIEFKRASGNGDIDHTMRPAFDGAYSIAFIRCHFVDIRSAAGASKTATFTIDLDSEHGTDGVFDVRIDTLVGIGLESDLNVRFKNPEEIAGYTFDDGDRVKFAWTNPDSLEIGWGLEVGFAPAT